MNEKDQKEMKEWAEKAAAGTMEGLEGSRAFISLLTPSMKKDPLCALQLGLAILHEKPIVIMQIEGTPIPEVLKRLAIHIEPVKDNEDMERATKDMYDAIKDII